MELLKNIENSFKNDPLKHCFVDENREWSYGEIEGIAAKYQFQIQSLNPINPYVAIILGDDILNYSACIASWFAGRCFIPLNPNFGEKKITRILKKTACNIIIDNTQSELSDALRQSFPLADWITKAEFSGIGKLVIEKTLDVNRLMYLLFTSGTTGDPKGVPISHVNLSSLISNLQSIEGFTFSDADIFVQPFDLTFDFSIHPFTASLFYGSTLHLPKRDGQRVFRLANTLIKNSITALCLTPSLFRAMKHLISTENTESLRLIWFCGEALKVSDFNDAKELFINANIYNFYGPTEATIFCSYFTQKNKINALPDDIVSIGKAFGDNVLDLLPYGDQNEIVIAGNQVFDDYVGDDEARFSELNKIRYYRSGDIGERDNAGDLHFKSRLDDQVKVNGYRIELKEVEHWAKSIDNIKDAVALVIEEGNYNKLILFISGNEFQKTHFEKKLQKLLSPYMYPSSIIRLDEIPFNLNGKLDRKKLRELATKEINYGR